MIRMPQNYVKQLALIEAYLSRIGRQDLVIIPEKHTLVFYRHLFSISDIVILYTLVHRYLLKMNLKVSGLRSQELRNPNMEHQILVEGR